MVGGEGQVLSNVVSSQMQAHALYGGVVPEVAARAHLENLPAALEGALETAGARLEDVGLVAATAGPGLIGALLVGLSAGKALAFARGLPLVPVNHLEGHLFSAYLLPVGGGGARPVSQPFHRRSSPVSGGHAELVPVDHGTIVPLATHARRRARRSLRQDRAARGLGLSRAAGHRPHRARGNGRRFPFAIGRAGDGPVTSPSRD